MLLIEYSFLLPCGSPFSFLSSPDVAKSSLRGCFHTCMHMSEPNNMLLRGRGSSSEGK